MGQAHEMVAQNTRRQGPLVFPKLRERSELSGGRGPQGGPTHQGAGALAKDELRQYLFGQLKDAFTRFRIDHDVGEVTFQVKHAFTAHLDLSELGVPGARFPFDLVLGSKRYQSVWEAHKGQVIVFHCKHGGWFHEILLVKAPVIHIGQL